ncbi:hypothetical protein B0H12DRAFT_1076182 [Mycena haematopus]|nr:hypothetical protein B0H12DRAFT_1076182 [Mycena haematopus]
MHLFSACQRLALRGTTLLSTSTTRLLSSNTPAQQTGYKKVRTRIVVDDVPHLGDDNDAEMNTRGWFDEEDEPQHKRRLSTLNPLHLTTADYTILSRQPHPCVAFTPGNVAFPIRFFKKDAEYQPFPPYTRGFFYYYVPRDLPPMAGGLRFRITPRGHPASFQDGEDLLHDGLPWQISLPNIATAVGRKIVLRQQLLNEGLVTQAVLDKCRTMMPTRKRLDPKVTLYRLEQPFLVGFDHVLYAWAIGETEIKPILLYMLTDHRKHWQRGMRPYTGSALAQFELSTLPEHAGSDTVVMRIVKMLTPPTCVVPGYDNYIPAPVEGELLRRTMGHGHGARLQYWYCNLAAETSDCAAALRMLVERAKTKLSTPDEQSWTASGVTFSQCNLDFPMGAACLNGLRAKAAPRRMTRDALGRAPWNLADTGLSVIIAPARSRQRRGRGLLQRLRVLRAGQTVHGEKAARSVAVLRLLWLNSPSCHPRVADFPFAAPATRAGSTFVTPSRLHEAVAHEANHRRNRRSLSWAPRSEFCLEIVAPAVAALAEMEIGIQLQRFLA